MAVAVKKAWIDTLSPNGTTPVGTKQAPKSAIILEMLGAPASSGAWSTVAYDSYLILHEGNQNHTLTLVLKIHLNPVVPGILPGMPRWPILDANKRAFLIRPWAASEWSLFTKDFTRECLKWNDHFWLIPPPHFSKLDVQQGGRVSRPNVYCHLYVTVVNSPAGAHRTIDVVNLDLQDAKERHALTDAELNSGAFRSDEVRYDSLDPKTRSQWSKDHTGTWHEVKNYSTIVHEIGHALGLPHIGVTHQDLLCQLALLWTDLPDDEHPVAALFNGRGNSRVCYGKLGVPARGANVMGGGSNFDESNAAPWARRLALHTGTKPTDWSVSTTKVPPKFI